MTQNVWCKIFGIHKYEVLKEEELRDAHGILVGKVIISRCSNCGKIKRTIYCLNILQESEEE